LLELQQDIQEVVIGETSIFRFSHSPERNFTAKANSTKNLHSFALSIQNMAIKIISTQSSFLWEEPKQ